MARNNSVLSPSKRTNFLLIQARKAGILQKGEGLFCPPVEDSEKRGESLESEGRRDR
jgi:hypothetical protein